MSKVVFYIGDRERGADILAAHAAGVAPYWINFPDGWYSLPMDFSALPVMPNGPFTTRTQAETHL